MLRTPDQTAAERDTLGREADEILNRDGALSVEDSTRLDAIVTELKAITEEEQERAELVALASRGSMEGLGIPGNRLSATSRDPLSDGRDQATHRRAPWADYRNGRVRTSADLHARALDAIGLDEALPEETRQAATAALERQPVVDDNVARTILLASDPDYVSGFSAILRGDKDLLTREEIEAVRRTRDFCRAMSTTAGAGGYLLPQAISPTLVQLTAHDIGGEAIRSASRVEITGDLRDYRFVTSTAVEASWDDEAEEASDDSSTLAEVLVPLERLTAYVPLSLELVTSVPNFTATVQTLILASFAEREAEAYTIGAGTSSVPTGLVTALDAVAGSEVATDAATTLDLDDVRDLLYAELPARWHGSARWMCHPEVHEHIREQAATDLAVVQLMLGTSDPAAQILRRPVIEASAMDTLTAGAWAGAENALVVGDFSNYGIVDAAQVMVESIPVVVGSNQRPTGQVGLAMFKWTGADCLNPAAFRLLQVTS